MTVHNESILITLLLSGLLGLIGQGVRVIIGLKKLREEATKVASEEQNTAVPSHTQAKAVFAELFDARKLWLSLLIGFIAGCLASLAGSDSSDTAFSKEAQLAIVAAGYAGTDFIEGILKKRLPGQ